VTQFSSGEASRFQRGTFAISSARFFEIGVRRSQYGLCEAPLLVSIEISRRAPRYRVIRVTSRISQTSNFVFLSLCLSDFFAPRCDDLVTDGLHPEILLKKKKKIRGNFLSPAVTPKIDGFVAASVICVRRIWSPLMVRTLQNFTRNLRGFCVPITVYKWKRTARCCNLLLRDSKWKLYIAANLRYFLVMTFLLILISSLKIFFLNENFSRVTRISCPIRVFHLCREVPTALE